MGIFGGSKKAPVQEQTAVALNTFRVQTSIYGLAIPIVYGQTRLTGNVIWYDDFRAVAIQTGGGQSGGGGGKGFGGGGSAAAPTTTSYQYFAAMALGLCEGPIDGIGKVWQEKNVTTLAELGLTLLHGTDPQPPWSYLETNHPGKAIGYQALAYVANSGYRLNDSAGLPNHSFEILGRLRFDPGAGILDCDPAAVVEDFLTNAMYSVGFPAANLDDLGDFSDYCVAAGLFFSPFATEQTPAHEFLADLVRLANAEFVWSPPLLRVVPRGDENLSGNGVDWAPNLTPIYDLTDDDYLRPDGDEDPVAIRRSPQADAFNHLELEYLDRANDYNTVPVEAKLQDLIETFGLRPDPNAVKAHQIAEPAVARRVVQQLLQRQAYVRNEYTFSLPIKFLLLEPMDLVTATDVGLRLDRQLIRIRQIDEDEDDNLTLLCEEMPIGIAAAALYPHPVPLGYKANYNAEPGDVNDPIIFTAPVEIAPTGLEVWCGVSGGPEWGGAEVWLSSDGDHYQRVGRISGPARQGVLRGPLPAGPDPDLAHALQIDLSMSRTSLNSGTFADADAYHTLCYVGGELLSYQSAQLVAAGAFDLTYLRRGAYGTINGPHLAGAPFVRLDDAIFSIPYTRDQIGRTIFVKFVSFNIYGGHEQDLAEVQEYSFVLQPPPPPGDVLGFTAEQKGGTVVFKWEPLPEFALKGYDIRFAAQGTIDWDMMLPLTDAARGTEMTNASVPKGTWTFAIRALDVVDQWSVNATFVDLVVTSADPTIFDVEQAPDWVGDLVNFYRHWTGVLIPLSTLTPAAQGWETFDDFVDSPVATASYTSPPIDAGFDDDITVLESHVIAPGPGVGGAPAVSYEIDSWLTGEADPNVFDPWTVGLRTLRFLRGRIVHTPGANPGVLSAFAPIGEAGTTRDDAGAATVDPAGTVIAFARPFHQPPFVTVTPVGATALAGTASDITTHEFTAHVFAIPAGTEVGGDVSWHASGN